MIKETLRPSAAAVLLAGDMTDDLAEDLAGSLAKLRTRYYYDRVELEVASPGGALTALDRCLSAIGEARAGGMRVDTRVRTRAASAAALLASLGDRREAAPSALLLYHCVRAAPGGMVTAPSAAGLVAALAGSDRTYAVALAARARAPAPAPPPRFKVAEFAPFDWPVVERLAGGGGRRGERLRALRRRVADGISAPDAKPLAVLYMELLALDAWISARLAAELLLIDRVADAAPADGRTASGDGGLTVPEWRSLYPNGGTVPRAALCRHALILGETGSGKTASGVLPLVSAALRPDSPVGCLLVIDPKREIGDEAARLADGVRVIDPEREGGAPRIDLMAGPLSPAEDLAAGRVATAARAMLMRAGSLDRLNPARTFTGDATIHHDAYWPQQGARLAMSALSLALILSVRRADGFGDRTRAAALRGLPTELRRTCAAPGLETGYLVEDAGVTAAAEAARDRLDQGEASAAEVLEGFERAVRETALHQSHPAFRDEFDELAGDCRNAFVEEPAEAAPPPRWEPLPEAFDDPMDGGEEGAPAGDPERDERRRRRWEARWASKREDALEANAAAVRAMAANVRAAAVRCAPEGAESARANVMAAADRLLTDLYAPPEGGLYSSGALAAATVAERLRPALGGGEIGAALDDITGHWSALADSDSHYRGIVGFARLAFTAFTDPLPKRTLFFGCEPGFSAGAEGALDFAADVAARGRHAVHVVRPRLGAEADALYARALKATFFEAVLNCPERAGRGGADMPLVGYVADECHRFITSDPVHGEQSFLDTCRSFGAFCALACQSVASLRHALGAGGGDGAHEPAIDILLANTGTKLFFRSTERGTRETLNWLCPSAPDGLTVVDLRPPPSLAPGECYALLPDGRFERRQLEPHRFPEGGGGPGVAA